MRWENSFLFLTDITDMKDTERIPWKAMQSHPSAGSLVSRGGIDTTRAAPRLRKVKMLLYRCSHVNTTLENGLGADMYFSAVMLHCGYFLRPK